MSAPKRSKLFFAIAWRLALALFGLILAGWYCASPSIVQADRPHHSRRQEVRGYIVGYGLALILTCAAFAAVHWQSFTSAATFAIVLGLAFLQMLVHFRFFLHISLRKSARDDLQLILFSALIMILMISGTLVILFNLRARMM